MIAPYRVCIRCVTPGGVLYLPANTRVRSREDPSAWIPVPDLTLAKGYVIRLLRADATRPAGIHPALWYGHLPGEPDPDTRTTYTVTTCDGAEYCTRAYSLKGALIGVEHTVLSVIVSPQWY
jgi:hypothetical protein